LHLVAASWCIALRLRARQSARPTLARCCLDCRCYLITAADQIERSALLSTPIYLCLCSRAAGRCFSFTVLPAVPAAYYLPTTTIHTLGRLSTRLYPSTTTTTTLSLPQPCAPTKSRDRIPPPSHPASAQHASTRRNRPSILTLLHSALLLGLSCTTNRRSGHNLNSPTATAFPPISHPPPDYSVSSRTGHPLLLLLLL